jgi:LPXTG-motif cell wall-anchored protein
MVRTSQTARGRSLRTSTRIAALLGAAALSTVSGIAYAATQPTVHSNVTAQAQGSSDPTDTPTGLPTGGASSPTGGDTSPPGNGGPTETASPEPPGNGGSGGGGPQGGGGNQQGGGGAQQGGGNKQSGGNRQSGGQAGTSGDGLPVTGTDVTSIVVLGGMLTAGGAGLVLTARRCRRTA